MNKTLDLNRSVYDLAQEYPELIKVMVGLGFSTIAKAAALDTVGRVMTVPKGCDLKGISLDDAVTAFQEAGFSVEGVGDAGDAEPATATLTPEAPAPAAATPTATSQASAPAPTPASLSEEDRTELLKSQCQHDWEMRATVCAFGFSGIGARIATIYKDHHERRLAGVIAAAMACSLDEAASWPARDGRPRYDADATDAICFVPATSAAYARRGFDHMGLVAGELSHFLGLPLLDCLVRDDALDQRELGKEDRAQNLAGSMEVVEDVRGLRLLLADDVVTTGATLRAATQTLLEAGAAEVTCCSFVRVW